MEAADNILKHFPERCLNEPFDVNSPTKIPYPCFDIRIEDGVNVVFPEENDERSDNMSSTLSCDGTASFSSASTSSKDDDIRHS